MLKPAPSPPATPPGTCSLIRAGHVTSWESYLDLGNSSSSHTLIFGLEDTNSRVYKEVFLFLEDFPIYQFHMSSQKEGAFSLLSPFRELGQDYVNVSEDWRSTLSCLKLQNFLPCNLPSCSHLEAKAEDVLYVLDKIFSPACWVMTQISSALPCWNNLSLFR